jgi:Prohead core protein serine protease
MGLKFITTELHEEINFLVEQENRKEDPKYFMTGPYMLAGEKNQNGRIYDLVEMQREVDRYTNDMIKTRRAIGEMNHPQSTEVNPVNACHLVVELKQKDNYFYGKSQILDTPMGQLLKSLVKDKIQMGISTRGLGSLTESTEGKKVSNFHLICLDVVHQPSVKNAMLESVLESKEWMIDTSGNIIEVSAKAYETLREGLSNLPRKEVNLFLQEQLTAFINKLKLA